MPDKRYEYETCCVNVPPEDVNALNEMIDGGVQITRGTFLRHCQDVDRWAEGQGYELHSSRGLTLGQDYHVAYFRGEFKGRRCYFLVWSAIEFIWTEAA